MGQAKIAPKPRFPGTRQGTQTLTEPRNHAVMPPSTVKT